MMKMVIFLFFFLVFAQTCPTSQASSKWEGSVLSEPIKGKTADQVWALFEDWCNIFKFFPFHVSFCTEGVPNRPGLIRFMANRGLPTGGHEGTVFWERHRLLEMNPANRTLTYSMLENNQGVAGYVPTLSVVDNHSDGCQIKWSFVADVVDGWTLEVIHDYLRAILALTVENIQKLGDDQIPDLSTVNSQSKSHTEL